MYGGVAQLGKCVQREGAKGRGKGKGKGKGSGHGAAGRCMPDSPKYSRHCFCHALYAFEISPP